ncbi:MAG: chemotaxis protein CheA [endosymbiont of Galathealinum brachiosum]|uniref:Chemotaxis protein CheA n=1 Tax=endosymbiont of Galathealinum brachiosum TaxID=2200906 RepID=A0A370DLB0_9GAMM|nr:MAG: chemotaxis protein CheA [endosymbiont of Galathealinum brachiosum]
MSLDENTQIFVTESHELLEDMESALLDLERSPNDADLINRVFRAAHTIKGSSGLFGFDHIVEFTHVAENLLDDVRNCLVPVSGDLISLFMRVKDHISLLIQSVVDDSEVNQEENKALLEMLNAFKAGSGDATGVVCENNANDSDAGEDPDEDVKGKVKSEDWHISIRLGIDTFRQGFNPQVMFNQIKELGEIKKARLVTEVIPLLNDVNSESCFMGWEIILTSSEDKNTISEVFEFFDDAKIDILPPKSHINDYKEMIKNLPDDDLVIGQILVEIGALTENELQQALNQQKEEGGLTGDILIEQGSIQPEVVDTVVEKQKKIRNEKQRELSFVRVDSEKLDVLVTLVGELVISGAKVSQMAEHREDDELIESMEEMMTTLEEMRESALGLRMVPIANTLNRFNRVVRDISKDLNKKIRLEITGGETELDKTVIERIGDPLTHLIRNSMDHGIELPAERVLAGKEEEGVIHLKAFHETGTIVIEVIDNGKGLDAEKLFSLAKERGLVKEGDDLSDKEIYNLIFEPGFSTAKTVSNISGRGVGMDVVRRNIEALRGSVAINSEKNIGTTISIRLPLTLAIIDGFHVRVADESFIIPLDMIDECVTLTEDQKEEVKSHNYINLREEVLPLIRMDDYLGIQNSHAKTSRINVVVVQFAGKKLGLLVDELDGEAQAVIKPLGRVFQGVRGFAGFTILGSGQLALIMDIPDLVKSAIQREKTEHKNQYRPQEDIEVTKPLIH